MSYRYFEILDYFISFFNQLDFFFTLECNTIDFDKEITYSEFLTDWYVDYMKSSIKPYLNNVDNSSMNPQIVNLNRVFPQNATTESIRENIVAFNIFYEDLNYNLISDLPQTNWFLLLANLAGIAGGSFLGMSFLAILEFFEYVCFMFFIIIKHFFAKISSLIRNSMNFVKPALP